ncbi:hypothetical protein AOQ84DRAFT_215841 [Glonium stellatum]|uniref:Uncharacterized protein n=1 Tax=Glonium stellatum TaxID=574774 RepID=A0A8E2JUV8_9PEZI|nr:hypothetical protein AOQ84DRAFT_215841 [Glonium stellatum]
MPSSSCWPELVLVCSGSMLVVVVVQAGITFAGKTEANVTSASSDHEIKTSTNHTPLNTARIPPTLTGLASALLGYRITFTTNIKLFLLAILITCNAFKILLSRLKGLCSTRSI